MCVYVCMCVVPLFGESWLRGCGVRGGKVEGEKKKRAQNLWVFRLGTEGLLSLL